MIKKSLIIILTFIILNISVGCSCSKKDASTGDSNIHGNVNEGVIKD